MVHTIIFDMVTNVTNIPMVTTITLLPWLPITNIPKLLRLPCFHSYQSSWVIAITLLQRLPMFLNYKDYIVVMVIHVT